MIPVATGLAGRGSEGAGSGAGSGAGWGAAGVPLAQIGGWGPGEASQCRSQVLERRGGRSSPESEGSQDETGSEAETPAPGPLLI